MTDTRDDDDAEARELERYANAGAQPNQPRGHALVGPTRALTPIGAQPLERFRDEPMIRRKLVELAAMAGEDWFYRFPVRKAGGGQDWIEGPSIKLANSVARIYGNNVTEVREIDQGDSWTFYARFTDLETGFSMERAYRQRKSQASIKTRDRDRQLDQAYQIGQSKAIRNVVVNALQEYADFAFEQAQGSLVTKIGKDLGTWRHRTLEGLARIPVEVERVERVIGRARGDWLATDIARIVASGKAISDGMATVDETWPPVEAEVAPAEKNAPAGSVEAPAAPPAEPAPSDPVSPEASKAAQPAAPSGETTAAPTDPVRPEPGPPAEPKPKTGAAPKNKAEYMDLVRSVVFAATDAAALKDWWLSAQQKKIRNGAGMTAADAEEGRELVLARIKEIGSP